MVRCINNTHRLAFNLQTEGVTRQAERTQSVNSEQDLVNVCSPTAGTNVTEHFISESAVRNTHHTGYECRILPVGGGGGQNRTWVLGICQGVNLQRGGRLV
jgi:hypothetical protein